MNKQEAIKTAEFRVIYPTDVRPNLEVLPLEEVKNIISQIHEPQKVVVPAFIDSFIKYTKAEGMSLFIAMDNAQNKESEWIIKHEDTFARAWLDGYEIEQEELYTVEIPNPNRTTEPIIYLSRDEVGKIFLNTWFIFVSQNWENQPHARLTEAEIKQDFEWAFQFAKPVEEK